MVNILFQPSSIYQSNKVYPGGFGWNVKAPIAYVNPTTVAAVAVSNRSYHICCWATFFEPYHHHSFAEVTGNFKRLKDHTGPHRAALLCFEESAIFCDWRPSSRPSASLLSTYSSHCFVRLMAYNRQLTITDSHFTSLTLNRVVH